MGISREAYDQATAVVGHLPTMGELSTLLAMWQSNGQQQSLYGWLCGQHHTLERDAYLYDGTDDTHRSIKEPRVQECADIARRLCGDIDSNASDKCGRLQRGELIYMVGNVSTDFLDSDYGRKYLHIYHVAGQSPSHDIDGDYLQLIVAALHDGGMTQSYRAVGRGGLFCALTALSEGRVGFDILTCREIRLDAFLFGEEAGRFVVSLPEENDDLFLAKIEEARINCCFLGRSTKGRVLIDGMDFGPVSDYAATAAPCD